MTTVHTTAHRHSGIIVGDWTKTPPTGTFAPVLTLVFEIDSTLDTLIRILKRLLGVGNGIKMSIMQKEMDIFTSRHVWSPKNTLLLFFVSEGTQSMVGEDVLQLPDFIDPAGLLGVYSRQLTQSMCLFMLRT